MSVAAGDRVASHTPARQAPVTGSSNDAFGHLLRFLFFAPPVIPVRVPCFCTYRLPQNHNNAVGDTTVVKRAR